MHKVVSGCEGGRQKNRMREMKLQANVLDKCSFIMILMPALASKEIRMGFSTRSAKESYK